MQDDLVAALRSLRKSPAFTTVAIAILALAIGAGTAIYSVVDAVVLRALPFDEHDRLMAVLEHDTTRPVTFGGGSTTPQTYLDWRRLQTGFDGLAAVSSATFRLRSENREPADARAQSVTPEFFGVLRVTPSLGRPFNPDDERQERKVVVLSDAFWRGRYGEAPDVVGRTLDLDETPYEIVGVLPRGFVWPVGGERPADVFVPASFGPNDRVRKDSHNFNWLAIGRLAPGVTRDRANAAMNTIAEALDHEFPKWGPGRRVQVVPLQEHLVGKARGWMLMLLGAVALVLLIACANVANLLLARATTREREIGIRAALGASRWRLTRALLVEGLVLAFVSAALGMALAWGGVHILRVWLPSGLPRVAAIGIDMRVLLMTVAMSTATGLFFGLVPAVHASRPDLTRALKDGGRSSTASRASQRLRGALVVIETALAVILLVGAGLFTTSFVRLMRIDPGFDYHNVIALNVWPRIDYATTPRDEALRIGREYTSRVFEAVRAVPGVREAALLNGGLPLSGSWSRRKLTLPGGRSPLADDEMSIDSRQVTPGYLELLRIRVVRGRPLTADDRETSERVALVNETAARKYWPDDDPIGQRFTLNSVERRVVGIVADVHHLGPESPPRQECYVPLSQDPSTTATVLARTDADPLAVLPAVKAAIWSVAPEQRLTSDITTMEGYMDRLIAQRRFNMAVLSLFGLLGLVIAAAGIYGVMSFLVAQRTSEIGVRMALGATRGHVLRLVLTRAGVLLGMGLALGAAVAYGVSAGVRSFLFEVEPTSVGVFAAAIATLAAAGLLASLVPARRAASVDPIVALRQE